MSDLILKQQVEALYQQSIASEKEFCIDLEGQSPDGQLLWQWAYLSRADNARRSVVGKKQLIEGEHYLLLRSEVQVPHQGGMRSQEVVRIVFSLEGFELWLLMLDTPRGHEIRQFFRQCHKRLQLEMSQPTAMTQVNEAIVRLADTVNSGLTQTNNRLVQVEEKASRIDQKVDQLVLEVAGLAKKSHKRKDFSPEVRRLYQAVVDDQYHGACPCCRQHKAKMQVDHWYDRSRNKRDDGWLICTDCNTMLGPGGSRERDAYAIKFKLFQERVNELDDPGQLGLDLVY